MRSLARRNLLLVLITSTEAALVSTAGAAISDSSANGFCDRSGGAAGIARLQRAEQRSARGAGDGDVDDVPGPEAGRRRDDHRPEGVGPAHELALRALRGLLDQDVLAPS